MNDQERQAVDTFRDNIGLNDTFTVQQVAGILRVHPRTIMSYIAGGKLRGSKVAGRWRFTAEAVESFIRGEG